MLPMATAEGVRSGTVTCAFRRWDEPRVRVGGTQLTSAGIVRFDSVEVVPDVDALTDEDARAAGLADVEQLRERLRPGDRPRGPRSGKGGHTVFRVGLSWVGEDPRLTLREKVPRGRDLAELTEAVARLDAARRAGSWTTEVLVWIRDHPGVISTELADLLGRELLPLKADIRKLKALGLTISLRTGYELSPRGRAYLRSVLRRSAEPTG